MSWDTEFIWDAPVRPAKDKAAIHHAIATIKAGGGTDGYPALKESYQVLFERPALLKHVIFLSDGQMTRGDFQGLLRTLGYAGCSKCAGFRFRNRLLKCQHR